MGLYRPVDWVVVMAEELSLEVQMKKRFDEIKRLTTEAYAICQQHKDSCANLSELAPEEKFKVCPFSGKGEQGARCLMYAFCNMFNEVFPEILITDEEDVS